MQMEVALMPFTLTLVGEWRLDHAGRNIDVSSKKARALFAYLALSDVGRHSRETLARVFWADAPPAHARASLRQAISGLNRALGKAEPQVFFASSDEVWLNSAAVTTDLDRLHRAIEAGLPDSRDARLLADLRRLFLSEIEVAGEDFESWRRDRAARACQEVQARLAQVFGDVTRTNAERMRAAQTAILLDDLDEAAVRAMMACHVESGNAVVALRLYGELHSRLEQELDAEPSIETQQLAVAIKRMELAPEAAVLKAPVVPGVSTVAVLPFDFLGVEPMPDFVAFGLLDQITCQLASYRAPAVISSNSTRRYMGVAPTLGQVRADLGATYVVTGSVLRQGDQVALAVQLVDCISNLVLWAGSFNLGIDALFNVRSRVADSIVNAILPTVNLEELRRAEERPAETLESYHLVLMAKDMMFRLDRATLDKAGGVLQRATTQEPHFAPAHALMAEWCALRLWQGWSDAPEADRAKLEHHAGRAIALSPGSGRSIALLAHCRMLFEQRYDEALAMFDEALAVLPNDSETLIWTVPTLAYAGHPHRAIENGYRANILSPLDPFLFRNEHFLSVAHFVAGEYERAAELGLSCYRRAPDYGSNLRMTIAALQAAGRGAEAVPLVTRHQALNPKFSVTAFMPGHRLRDVVARERFAGWLIEAGLPA